MSYETNDKMVSHPDHYKSGKYEVIDIIDEFTKDLSGTEAVCTANAIKYILRWKKKNGIQDVKKAIWYLTHLVDKEEERLQEEHAEFDEERLEKITEIVPTVCKTCKHENDTCRDECTYLNPVDWEPKEELLKKKNHCGTCEYQWNTTKCPRAKETPGTISCENSAECCSEWTPAIIKNYMNSQKVPTKPLKSMEEICEDIIAPKEEVDMDKIMNPPYDELYKMNNNQKETINSLLREKKEMQDSIDILTDDKKSLQDLVRQLRGEKKQPMDEEIHNCDDCVNKANEPWDDPCQSCDLHQNPPSKWVAED